MRLRGAGTNEAEQGIGQAIGGRRSRVDGRRQAMALRTLSMFAYCSQAELRLLDTLMCEMQVPAGRVLVREGHAADQMLLIISGRARVSRGGETLGTAERGACIGGRELRAETANTVTMTAETPMVVRAASGREVRSLLYALPLVEFVSPLMIRLPDTNTAKSDPSVMNRNGNGGPAERRNGGAASIGTTASGPPPVRSGAAATVVDEIEAFLRHDSVHDSDRVLAAVMFTDIVGSTIHLTTLGDGAWHALLDAHDLIVGHEVHRHGGTVVNFLGDGALARFECANTAVHCALAIRDGMRDLGIDLRAGLHVGEVELRGTDISGIAVHIASRICGVADSGRVLASRTLVDLVAGSGLVFEDAGTHLLKGVGGEWSLLAVAG
jgi:class 3 adenylate cyclase